MEFFLFLVLVGFLAWYIWGNPGGGSSSWTLPDVVGVVVIVGVLGYLGYQAYHQVKRKRA